MPDGADDERRVECSFWQGRTTVYLRSRRAAPIRCWKAAACAILFASAIGFLPERYPSVGVWLYRDAGPVAVPEPGGLGLLALGLLGMSMVRRYARGDADGVL